MPVGRLILGHPGGPQNVHALVSALAGAGLLDRFVTTFGWNAVAPGLPRSLRDRLERRAYPALSDSQIEAAPLASVMLRGSVDATYRAVDRRVAGSLRKRPAGISGVYCYEDGAREAFQTATTLGVARIYEMPSPYWRALKALSEEEVERQPEWASALPALWDSPAKYTRKDEEIAAADRIVVASSFACQTLEFCPVLRAPVKVVFYGAPPLQTQMPSANPYTGGLRALYVGNLNQQKGVAYLFQAMRRLPGINLTMVGKRPVRSCPPLDAALQTHRYRPPVSHSRVLDIMAAHDVLVFPTLFDGFGLVILEAMSRGLPVIATTNSAAPDIIEDGVDGFIVPIRDADAIADRLERLATDRPLLEAMGHAAQSKAAKWSWDRYGTRMTELLHQWLA